MKNVEVVVKQDLFDGIGLKVAQLNCHINEENDFRLYGSITAEDARLDGYLLHVKANLCDEEGGILYIFSDFSEISFEMVKYDTFSMYCTDLTRFFNIDKLSRVELYPKVMKKKDEERGRFL